MCKASTYQIEMVRKNIVKGIVKMNLKDDGLQYDMDGLRLIGKIGVARMIRIIDIIRGADEFFFYRGNFILDKDRIYTDKNGGVRLMYIPVKGHKEKIRNIEAFISCHVRSGYIRENLLGYMMSDSTSYFAYNKKRLAYIMAVLSLSIAAAVFAGCVALMAAVPFLAAPLIKGRPKAEAVNEETGDRTMILSERDKITVCFSDIFGNEKDIRLHDSDSGYIGRDEKECSLLIRNTAVGRRHAKLTYANGKVAITDNDSLNNTYINGRRLKKNRQYEVADGDRVVFANEEYMVFIKK